MTPRAARRAIPPIDPTIAGTRGTTAVLWLLGGAGVAVGVVPGPPAGVTPGVKNGASKDDEAEENDEVENTDDDDSPEDDEKADAEDSAEVDEINEV